MVFETINQLFDSSVMAFGSEFLGVITLGIKMFGFGWIVWQLLKLVFRSKK